MIHSVIKEDGGGTHYVLDTPYRLEARHTLLIPALCLGTIPHGIVANSRMTDTGDQHSFLMIVGEPDVLVSHNLIVCPQPVPNGDVVTYVFNISSQQLRIRKGEVISRLVRVLGSVWI